MSVPRIKRRQDSEAGSGPAIDLNETAAGGGSVESFTVPASEERKARRRGGLTKSTITLRASALSRKVGYLQVEPAAHRGIFDALPKQSFQPGEIIACDGLLCVIERGSVQIGHCRHKYLIKEMTVGGVFGDMPLLGQSMLMTEAVAGTSGAVLIAMNAADALRWITSEPGWLLKIIGPRLAAIEVDYYLCQFSGRDPRIAALLLRLAGDGVVIEGVTRTTMAAMIGVHRENIGRVLSKLESQWIMEIRRGRITILDKQALREMSES